MEIIILIALGAIFAVGSVAVALDYLDKMIHCC